jgi:hypothetical protein
MFLTLISIFTVIGCARIAYIIYINAPSLVEDIPAEKPMLEKALMFLGVTIQTRKSLPAWIEPDASPDALVCNRPGETPEDFANRVDYETGRATPARWVVVIPKGFPVGMVYSGPAMSFEFDRRTPPYAGQDWPDIVPHTFRFRDETEDEYRAYLSEFFRHFPEWAQMSKILSERDSASSVFRRILRAAVAACLLFLSANLSAQKFEQVNALPIGAKVAQVGASVTYQFERTDIYRIGDGRKNYADLLKNTLNFRNGGGGKLLAIYAGDVPVYRAAQVEQVAEKQASMRPYNVTTNAPNFTMPDSAAMVQLAEKTQYEIWKAGRYAGAMAKPWWDVVMMAFWTAFPILLILALIAYLFARVFASEGMRESHRVARRTLVYLLLTAAAVLLVNLMLLAISSGFGPVGLTLIGGALAFVSYLIVSRLTPNYTPAEGNDDRQYTAPQYPGLRARN